MRKLLSHTVGSERQWQKGRSSPPSLWLLSHTVGSERGKVGSHQNDNFQRCYPTRWARNLLGLPKTGSQCVLLSHTVGSERADYGVVPVENTSCYPTRWARNNFCRLFTFPFPVLLSHTVGSELRTEQAMPLHGIVAVIPHGGLGTRRRSFSGSGQQLLVSHTVGSELPNLFRIPPTITVLLSHTVGSELAFFSSLSTSL